MSVSNRATIAQANLEACGACKRPIVRGQRIKTVPGLGIVHFGCSSSAPAPLTPRPLISPTGPDFSGDEAEPVSSDELPSSGGKQSVAAIADSVLKNVMAQFSQRIHVESSTIRSRILSDMQGFVGEAAEDVVRQAKTEVMEELGRMFQTNTRLTTEAVHSIIEQLRSVVAAEVGKTHRHIIEIKTPTEVTVLEDDLRHEVFPEVLELASIGMNVFLPGPTGCGKTHLCKQVAKALGLPFGMVSGSAGTTESEIFGHSIPNISTGENNYIESDFVRIYEGGGVFLIDEGDAMDPNVLLKINAAISNGFCAVPKRTENTMASRSEHFIAIMAANTFGHGATRAYCGRNRLDGATLDRFLAGTVPMGYDERLESLICPNPELFAALMKWRKAINDGKLQRNLSTRFCGDAFRLVTALKKPLEVIRSKLVGGWSDSEAALIKI